MRILWVSNYTVKSAYMLQSHLLTSRIQNLLHHDITVVDIRNGGSSTSQIGDVTALPTGYDPLGNDMMLPHVQRSKSDVVITLCDAWGFNPDAMSQVNWFPITPVDHSPVPPNVIAALKSAKGIIALSRFGQAELRKKGIDSLYMPHALDPETWYPALTFESMVKNRNTLQISADAFLVSFVGVNDSNPSRKGIPELLAAWAMFWPTHQDSLLYLHTTTQGNIPIAGARNGVDIDAMIETFGIHPRSILMPDQYRLRTGIPASELATMARASNVFILPTRGEGFGVPLIEYQHAGCPVITTDFAAGAELCASGWTIDYEMGWSWQNSTYANPGILSIVEQIERAYAERGNLLYRQQAAQFARDYEIDYVFTKYVEPTLTHIAESLVLSAQVA